MVLERLSVFHPYFITNYSFTQLDPFSLWVLPMIDLNLFSLGSSLGIRVHQVTSFDLFRLKFLSITSYTKNKTGDNSGWRSVCVIYMCHSVPFVRGGLNVILFLKWNMSALRIMKGAAGNRRLLYFNAITCHSYVKVHAQGAKEYGSV